MLCSVYPVLFALGVMLFCGRFSLAGLLSTSFIFIQAASEQRTHWAPVCLVGITVWLFVAVGIGVQLQQSVAPLEIGWCWLCQQCMCGTRYKTVRVTCYKHSRHIAGLASP